MTAPGEALSAALATTRGVLGGPGRGRRWRQLAVLAAMAGIVGAGAAPPPLGLLQPVGSEPNLRQAVLGSPVIVGGILFLALFLLFMGGVARAFTFGFLEGIATGEPQAGSYRRYLRPAVVHYIWSSCLTVPLYLLLFAGEALATHDVYLRFAGIINDPAPGAEAQALGLIGLGVLRFLLVLLPWTLLTLPLMVLMYELTPAAMLTWKEGPPRACGRALRLAGTQPRLFWGYLGLRALLQIVGNTVAFLVLLPCLLVSAVLSMPILGIAWGLALLFGGPGSSGGVAVLTAGSLLSIVVLYCALCAALLPVSVLLNAFALQVVRPQPQEA